MKEILESIVYARDNNLITHKLADGLTLHVLIKQIEIEHGIFLNEQDIDNLEKGR